ncbi:hypothetical protein SAMN04487950_4557 [Halogranum rubrum]|uniref:Uncharacterized protein n=1 Tax=Halogranum rubrum TaxID=553466 RepID=A0A1I4JKU6_9EURY|nr:hypothetical protein [Halogranum rubrum]SFL67208.1 hypothetical protein SAMN04487950_4557 [Halogranum rubrum]
MSSESLSELYIPEMPVDEEKLIGALKSYLRIVPEPNRFRFEEPYQQLNEENQILTILLGQLAWRELVNDSNSASLTPMEVSKYSEIGLGRLYPKLRRLEQEGIVENAQGRYYVNTDRLNEAIKRIQGKVPAGMV